MAVANFSRTIPQTPTLQRLLTHLGFPSMRRYKRNSPPSPDLSRSEQFLQLQF